MVMSTLRSLTLISPKASFQIWLCRDSMQVYNDFFLLEFYFLKKNVLIASLNAFTMVFMYFHQK